MTDHSTPTRQNDNSLDVLTLFTQLDIERNALHVAQEVQP